MGRWGRVARIVAFVAGLAALDARAQDVAAQAPTATGEASDSAVRELLDAGRYDDAEAQARALLARIEAEQGADSLAAAKIIDLLIGALLNGGKAGDPATRSLAERSLAIREQALGPEHADVATSLSNLATLLRATGDYSDARPLYERALALRERSLGGDHLDVATDLNNLAGLLKDVGDHTGARPLFERSLIIRERALGPEHPDVARSLNNLAALLRTMGDLTNARPLHERALAIREKVLGPEHPVVATSLNNLAALLRAAGDLAGARKLHERALAIREKALGPAHPDVAMSLNNLALILQELGDYAGARALYERCLAIRVKTLGLEHPDVAMSMHNMAALLRDMGDNAEAQSLYERSLAIKAKTLGPNHPEVAASLSNLAGLLQGMGDYASARTLHERALLIHEKVFGPEHPRVATTLNGLASLMRAMGTYVEARPLYERSLAINERMLGPEHPHVATSLNNLALLLREIGDHAAAAPLYERSLAISEKALGHEHPTVAMTLNNLAVLTQRMGDHGRARLLFERSLAMREKVLGPEHPDVAQSLNNLALLMKRMGDPAGARSLYERSLAIYEKSLGPEHPDVAMNLHNLAVVLQAMGTPAEAQALEERALAIWTKALGADHPDVATSLENLASLHCATGETTLALDAALRAEEIGRNHARLTFRALSERQALGLAAVRAQGLGVALSLASAGLEPDARARACDAAMRSRALVLDEIGARHRDVAGSPALAPLAQQLVATTQRLANLTVRGPGNDSPEHHRKMLDAAARDVEQAERALAEQSATFRDEKARARIGLDDVANALAPGDALIAFWRYGRLAVGAKGAPITRPSRSRSSYLAFVLRGGERDVAAIDLGSAERIDDLVAAWSRETTRPRARPGGTKVDTARPAGDALRRAIWDPLAPQVKDARRVFLVPDGALHLVSFATLPAETGGFLVESEPLIHYLSAERDLVPSVLARPTGEGLLAVGGPSFDVSSRIVALAPTHVDASALARAATGAFRGETARCSDFTFLRFPPLPAAAQEVAEIASLWEEQGLRAGATREVVRLSGESASEAAVKGGAHGHRVLHLATHGFFLAGACASPLEGAPSARRSSRSGERPSPTTVENPLKLSGLALAGANRREAVGLDEEDGILTAEEIASLDLSATEWAVLSACDTGLGDIEAGEGVFGLRRAFQVAGARTLVMSLWPVDDEATRRWMRELYRARLVDGRDTASCVREASLAMLRYLRAMKLDDSPFWWGAFVAAGEWR